MNSFRRLSLTLALLPALFAAACSGGGSSTQPPPPPVGGFTNANLKGQYAFSMSGQNVSTGSFFSRVGVFTADGGGNITGGIEDVNVTGTNETFTFGSSTYSIQANGRGVVGLSDTSGSISFSITLLTPNQGLIVETDGLATASGTFYLQNTSAFALSALTGNYVFDFSGLDVNGEPDSLVGQFVATGSGSLTSGLDDENDAGNTVSASPFTGASYQLDATNGPTFGRGALTFTSNGIARDYFFYIVDNTRIRFMEAGNSGLTIGDAVSQSSVPSSNTNFNGSFVFQTTGIGINGSLTRIGRFSANGSGGLGTIVADTNDAGTAAQLPKGSLSATTYSIDTNNPDTGRGTLTFTDSSLGTFQFAFYLSSSSSGVIQAVDVNSVSDGSVQLQTGSPFSNSSLAGNYGTNFSGVSTNNNTTATGEEDFVGQLVFANSSSNNVSGAMDFSEFSSNQGVFTNIAVSGNGLTVNSDGSGRNALSIKLAGNPSSTLDFAAYVVNSQTIYIAGTDSNRTDSGIVSLQAP